MVGDQVFSPDFWKAFRIPASAFAVLALMLLMRNVNAVNEYEYIRSIANFTIGASVIAYGHYLFHATWINRKKEPDLPFWGQGIAWVLHILWFFWIFFMAANL